jgi:hypothetical protein
MDSFERIYATHNIARKTYNLPVNALWSQAGRRLLQSGAADHTKAAG